MKHIIFGIVMLLCYTLTTGCTSLISPTTSKTTPLAIGVLGIPEHTLFENTFKVTALPRYSTPIRMTVHVNAFKPKTYKAYTKQMLHHSPKIIFTDSIAESPKFLTVSLVDQMTTIKALTSDIETTQYAKKQDELQIITTVSIVFPKALQDEIIKADAVFLVNQNYKQYAISLVKNGSRYTTISFAKATIFEHQTSCFCWGENEKNQISILDMVPSATPCPKHTYKNAEKAKKQIHYLKL